MSHTPIICDSGNIFIGLAPRTIFMKMLKAFFLTLFLVGVNVLLAGGVFKAEAQTLSLQERIAQAAESQQMGTIGGECKEFVKTVLRHPSVNIQLGTGYWDAYRQIGYPIPAEMAGRGDLIQIVDPAFVNNPPTGTIHSAIITKNLGNGIFEVVDSNRPGGGIIRKGNYNPEEDTIWRPNNPQVYYYRVDPANAGNTMPVNTTPAPIAPLAPGEPRIDINYFTTNIWAGYYTFSICHTGRLEVYLDDELILHNNQPDPKRAVTKLLFPKSFTSYEPYVVQIKYWDLEGGQIPTVSRSYFNIAGSICAGGQVVPFPTPVDNPGPTSTPTSESALFMSDVNISDGTKMLPGQSFLKTWSMNNNGNTTWNSGYKLRFQYGTKLGAPDYINLPGNVAPGQTTNLSISMVAPTTADSYRSYWKLQNANGQTFGDILWVDIQVTSQAAPLATSGSVKLFTQTNYLGTPTNLGMGISNAPSANSYSMQIPSGWSVVTYTADNRGGSEKCWHESVANLQNHNWHNAIQSAEVFNFNKCGGGQSVKLYRNANYDQLLHELAPTSNGTNVPSKNAYSMSIPSGWSVRTWDQDNTKGRNKCWASSTANLQNDESWQNSIDSMQIYTTNECGASGSFVKLCKLTGAHEGSDCRQMDADISSLGQWGFGNDTAKSIYMQGPWEAMLFEDDNYNGQRFKYRESNNDIRNFPGGGGNDYGTSSIKVRLYNQGVVTLYKEGDFNDGTPFKTDMSLDNLAHWDYDNIAKSVKVVDGYEAILCTNANFKGTCGRYKGSEPVDWGRDLNSIAYGLRSGLSSIRICKTACEPLPVSATLLEPADESSFIPGTNVDFVWSGEGEEFKVEVSGGGLSQSVTSPWLTNSVWQVSNLPISSNPYHWKIKSWNTFGESNWSASSQFYIKNIAPLEAYILGAEEVLPGVNVTLDSFITPSDATNLSYTWSPAPASGQGTAVAVYNFSSSTSANVTLTVSNNSGTVTAQHTLTAALPTPTPTQLPTSTPTPVATATPTPTDIPTPTPTSVVTPTPSEVNVALQKSIIVSSVHGGNTGDRAVDGSASEFNRWITPDISGPHWAEIDLGEIYQMNWAKVYNGDVSNNPISDFVIQYWNGMTWIDIPGSSVTGNTSLERALTFTSPVISSKIRFYSTVNGHMRLKELEVYGWAATTPTPTVAPTTTPTSAVTPTPTETNVAYLKSIVVDSEHYENVGTRAVDGSSAEANRWITPNTNGPHWAEVDLGGIYQMNRVSVYTGDVSTNPIPNFVLQYWNGMNWIDIAGTEVIANTSLTRHLAFTNPVIASKIRFYSNTNGHIRLKELEVYGWLVSSPTPTPTAAPTSAPIPTSTPTTTPTPTETNVAYQKSVSVSSTNGANTANKAVDGQYSNDYRWMSLNTAGPHWAVIDLTSVHQLNRAKVVSGNYTGSDPVWDFVLQYWNGMNWIDIPGTTRFENVTVELSLTFDNPIFTNKVRFYSPDDWYVRLNELELYGWTSSTTPTPTPTATPPVATATPAPTALPSPTPASSGTQLLSSAWYLTGSGGASEKYQSIPANALNGKTTLRITYDLHGMTALGGDASAIIFDQNGWQFVSLSNYGQNGLNGPQTVDIPLSHFTGLNPNANVGTLHTRFWYGSAFTVDITSIEVL